MRDNVTILHITDLHLLADPNARLHGWQVDKAFRCVLDAALAAHPDCSALILGGDLVDDGSDAGYQRLEQILATIDKPILAMAGNHENPDRMAQLVRSAKVHGALDIGGWRLIALNSHVLGYEHGHIDASQMTALNRWLREYHAPVLVGVHHPPITVGSNWLDAIGLRGADSLIDCVAQHANVRGVLCGHAHQATAGVVGGIPCWISPSTMRQFKLGADDFVEDTSRSPGYRALQLAPDGSITTEVFRVPSASRTSNYPPLSG